MRLSPDGLVVQELLYFGEEDGLFVVVVRLDKLVPRLGVAYEIRLVLVPHGGRRPRGGRRRGGAGGAAGGRGGGGARGGGAGGGGGGRGGGGRGGERGD